MHRQKQENPRSFKRLGLEAFGRLKCEKDMPFLSVFYFDSSGYNYIWLIQTLEHSLISFVSTNFLFNSHMPVKTTAHQIQSSCESFCIKLKHIGHRMSNFMCKMLKKLENFTMVLENDKVFLDL